MNIASIGIDLGKTTFHLVALDDHGNIVIRKKFSRKQLLAYTANLPSSSVGIEACSGAHFIGARLRDQGHQVRLIPAQFVKPFVKSNKNDFIDAEAIAEAVSRQNMRFVPIKTDDQLDLQALHRVRDRLVHRRTAVINQIRGFLLERGITFAKGPANLRNRMPDIVEDADANLTPRMRTLLDRLWQEWKQLESGIETASYEIEQIASQDEACQRLRQIPGVGPLVSTATVAAIGNGAAFRKGREFAAWLGLVPRQYSTGGKARLYGISKRGNNYLRRMFIHGARAVLMRVKYDTAGLGQWVHQLEARTTRNKVIVALANKLARIAWAVLFKGEAYRHAAVCAQA
jgi:transposase